jgi:peptidoglycan hydrolase-like protein with peptidoglycan-binding domain
MTRPIGFFNSLTKPPAAPAPAPATPPAPAPVVPGDRLTTSTRGPAHARFRGDTQLAQVLAGQATLAPGARGPAVKKVQQALSDMAFYIPGGVDGAYGSNTAQAVKNFQSLAKLPQTGTLDADTLKALDQYAPPAGQTSWSEGADPGPIPDPAVGRKKARVVVDISQHRLFLYDKDGKLEKIYGVRTGRTESGWDTKPGVKVVDGKNADPRAVSDALWPDSNGQAFGTRLLNLSDYDPKTGKKYLGAHKGQELHGTYQDYSIGRDFSHGCVGLRNVDVEEIFDKLGNGELVKFQA